MLVGPFLNGLEKRVNRELTAFANATKLFRVLKTEAYSKELQKDRKRQNDWAIVWEMKVNVDKCKLMHMENSIIFTYK